MGLFTGDADGYGGPAPNQATVKLNYPLDGESKLVMLVMPDGRLYAGRVELLTERQIRASDLIEKWKK